MTKPKTLIIQITNPKERKLMFARICELLAVDIDKEVSKLKITSTHSGITVNRDHLFDFLLSKKLSGNFDFEQGILEVECPVIQATGRIAVNAPETIKETLVDKIPEKKNSPLDNFRSAGAKEGTVQMGHHLPKEEEEDPF